MVQQNDALESAGHDQPVRRDAKIHFAGILEDYINFWEALNERSLFLLAKFAEDKIQFSDPYYEASRHTEMAYILEERLKGRFRVKYKLRHAAWVHDKPIVLLTWRVIEQKKKNSRPIEWDMMSEVHFSSRGRVMLQKDIWDTGAEFYERIPGVGAALKLFKQRQRTALS